MIIKWNIIILLTLFYQYKYLEFIETWLIKHTSIFKKRFDIIQVTNFCKNLLRGREYVWYFYFVSARQSGDITF